MGAPSFIILCNHSYSTTHWIDLVNIDCIQIKSQIIFLDYVSAMKGCQRVHYSTDSCPITSQQERDSTQGAVLGHFIKRKREQYCWIGGCTDWRLAQKLLQ